MPSHLDDPIDLFLLRRYVAGACTAEERSRVDTWVAEAPARRTEVEALRTLYDQSLQLLPDVDTNAGWAAMRLRGEGAARESAAAARLARRWPAATRQRGRGSWTGRFVLAAAAAVLTVGVVPVVVHVMGRGATTQPFREFATPAGSRSTMTLRDGTRLVLGPATRLRVPADFGLSGRTVELSGQAYFAVVHDAAHPFAVHTSRVTVRDVGTTFAVRAYEDDGAARVAVADGEVAIGSVRLHAHDLALIDGTGRVRTHGGADVTAELAWTQGGLAFHDTPLADVARDVARTFDLHVTIADSGLAMQLVTATFGAESADDVLDEVTRLVGARYERVGQRVVIRRGVGGVGRDRKATVPDPLRTARAGTSHE